MKTETASASPISWAAGEDLSVDEAVRAVGECAALNRMLALVPCVIELGVVDALSDVPESVADLAAKVGADADALYRVLRFISTYGFFIEDADGRFRHSPLSKVLRADHPQSQQALLRLGATPYSTAIVQAMGHTLRTGRPAVEIVAPRGLFNYLSTHPLEATIFDQAMTVKSQRQIIAILRAYDFGVFHSIADIGGGRGHLLRAILDSTPSAKGVLFDLPHVVAAVATLASERFSPQGGDFFKDPLPVCAIYLLWNVIHDWSDEKSIEILKAIRRAAPRDGRLLLFESQLPPGPERSIAKFFDVVMLGIGGRERTAAQYRELLSAAGFQFRRIISASPDLDIFESVVGGSDPSIADEAKEGVGHGG